MDAHDIEQPHDGHEHHGHGERQGPGEREPAHERDEHGGEQRADHAADAPGDRAHHVFRAAAAGRADVVGTAGMGLLQRTVGNSALGAMVQRSGSRSEAEETAGTEHGARPAEERRSPVHDVISSGGSPLDTDTRTDMESRMGADFSDVRVHHDTAAHESAKGVGAHAYTVGNNVVFQRDAYDPSSPQGRTTLAHELTHVIQQRNGPVEGTEAPGGIRVSDPSDRFEQEAVANADRVLAEPAPETASPAPAPVAGSAPAPASGPASATASAPVSAVQRTAAEDEDEQPADVQGSFVQRAVGKNPEEEEEEAPPA
ncbi:eCIS core domain-containing protein [Streptomyces californicus]|uniref:eCIS core domain-containing protein n=1 Tax=Streptomyces californicus TaxID=67351 RepID=UPI0033A741A6